MATLPVSPRDSTVAEYVDGTAVIDAIKDVRNDATATDWYAPRPTEPSPTGAPARAEPSGNGQRAIDVA